jgi:uncharacterized damage-inducible protein DinB
MRGDELGFLLDYDAWAMERALAAAARLDPAAFAAEAGPGLDAPRTTVLHCIAGAHVWRTRLQGEPGNAPAPDDAATLDELRALWRTEHALLEEYAAGLAQSELDEVVEQRRPDRVLVAERWQYLVHMMLHSMQHRSELAQALTALGHSPGELGLTAFLQERYEREQASR